MIWFRWNRCHYRSTLQIVSYMQTTYKHVGNTLIACLCSRCALLCILVCQLCSQTMCCQWRMRTLLFSITFIKCLIMVNTFKMQHITDTLAMLQMCFHVLLEAYILCSLFLFAKCFCICSVSVCALRGSNGHFKLLTLNAFNFVLTAAQSCKQEMERFQLFDLAEQNFKRWTCCFWTITH